MAVLFFFGIGVLTFNVLDHFFNGLVIVDKFERFDWTDTSDCFGVVTATQNAQIDELGHSHVKALKHLGQVDLQDRIFASFESSDQIWCLESQSVHILGTTKAEDWVQSRCADD